MGSGPTSYDSGRTRNKQREKGRIRVKSVSGSVGGSPLLLGPAQKWAGPCIIAVKPTYTSRWVLATSVMQS